MTKFKILFPFSDLELSRFVLLLFFTFHFVLVAAQKHINTEGTYTMELSRTATMEATELQCIEQARLSAIAREFGTTVTETTINKTRDINGQTENSFQLLTRTSVLGEWIEDKDEPIVSWHCDGERLNVTAKVSGFIRMFSKEGRVDLTFHPCVAGDPMNPRTEFITGEGLNALFKSSSNGYLSIYYIDHAANLVQRLFPAAAMATANHLPVEADKTYLLFNTKTAPNQGWQQATKEITVQLPLGAASTLDELVAVFSPVEYIKPSLSVNNGFEELSEESFETWIAELKGRQKHSAIKRVSILIGNK
jgi:hypothetical protein